MSDGSMVVSKLREALASLRGEIPTKTMDVHLSSGEIVLIIKALDVLVSVRNAVK